MKNSRSLSGLICAGITVVAAWGAEAPTSLLQKRVSFTLPAGWNIQQSRDELAVGAIQLEIPYALTDGTPYSANAALVAKTVPAEFTIKQAGDAVYQKEYEGMAIVNDLPDGEHWRTLVWSAVSGVTHITLDRFGVDGGVSVHFMVSFPLMEKPDPVWTENVVKSFNEICASLKIDGKNSNTVQIKLDSLPHPPK